MRRNRSSMPTLLPLNGSLDDVAEAKGRRRATRQQTLVGGLVVAVLMVLGLAFRHPPDSGPLGLAADQ